jgi:hypothetical protein
MASRRSSSSKKKGKKRPAKRGVKKVAKKRPAKTLAKTATKRAAKKAAPAPKSPAKKKPSAKKPAFNAKTDSANDPKWIAPVWDDEHLLGAHVSTAGGSHLAPARARAIGASAMQIFTKMANRWAERVCPDDECATFRAALADTRVRATIAHDSYLINLASPDATLRRRSIESFVAELQRSEARGIT